MAYHTAEGVDMGVPVETAACVAVGSELLGEQRVDTNSLKVTAAVGRYGVRVVEKRVVGDDQRAIARTITDLAERVDLLVVTGGLGPTADDVTRVALAEALGAQLVHEPEVEGWIRERYAQFGRAMPDACLSMALVLPGARILRNPRGTAPGVLVEHGRTLIVLLPGVPWEMEAMLEQYVLPILEERNAGRQRLSRTLVLSGVIESGVESTVRGLYDRFGRENITILASMGIVRLILNAAGDPDAAAAKLSEMERAFREVLGDDLAGVDVSGLEEVILHLLRGRSETLAVAESCTGGLVAKRLTDVPGASEVLAGGVVSYANEIKESLLGVPHESLVEHGAVSAEVARSMAEGVRSRCGTDWGLGITGIAGPGGGTEEKPVGLVHWAVAGPCGIVSRHRVFPGTRGIIRGWSANASMDLLRRCIAGVVTP